MTDPENHDNDTRAKVFFLSNAFEFGAVTVLLAAIGLVATLAMLRLAMGILDLAVTPSQLSQGQPIQVLFGMVMTVLIALEFGKSILRHLREKETIIQAREILLISMMAIVRKIMLVDLATEPPLGLVWLATATLALAAAYWLMGQKAQSE